MWHLSFLPWVEVPCVEVFQMSMAALQIAVLTGARRFFNNQKLGMKDILAWSTGTVVPGDGEIVEYVSDPGVFVAIKKEHDKRKRREVIS
jgi:hypothetical protein